MSTIAHTLRTGLGLLLAGLFTTASCAGSGIVPFGGSCETGADCVSGFCVGGEAGRPFLASFCSEECTGRKTGDACGDGQGRCIADFTAWCWVPCQTDADCGAVNNAQRAVCLPISSSGQTAPFKVCMAGNATSG